jgi:hypothetical protein
MISEIGTWESKEENRKEPLRKTGYTRNVYSVTPAALSSAAIVGHYSWYRTGTPIIILSFFCVALGS